MTAGRAPVAVHTEREEYRAALAELTSATAHAESARDAIAVIDGSGRWTERACAAVAAGASALVIAEPGPASIALLEELRAVGAGLPVIVSRRAMRADVVDESLRGRGDAAPLDILLVDATCTAAARADVIRDAIGWIHALGGGDVRLLSAAFPGGGVLAHLEVATPSGKAVPASLALAVATGGWRGSLLRVSGLGAVRTDVLIDSEARVSSVDTLSEHGSLRAPERFEEPARVALRRALDALSGGRTVADLAYLMADIRVSEEILEASTGHINDADKGDRRYGIP